MISNHHPSRRSDSLNERLPQFAPEGSPTMFPVPSMRVPGRSGEVEGMNMELLIKKTLEEEEEDGGIVERLADRIARGRRVTGRPAPLKRYETA
jgi:serine/threonine-protein phosphatase 2B catalytic subunit